MALNGNEEIEMESLVKLVPEVSKVFLQGDRKENYGPNTTYQAGSCLMKTKDKS